MKSAILNSIEEYIPSDDDARLAALTVKDLFASTKDKKYDFELLLKYHGKSKNLQIPIGFMPFLVDALNQIAHGHSVSLIPSIKEFTTQEAADILNVSRPFLIKLLETGEIPFYKVGSHRRIQAKDLMTFKQKMKKKSFDAMEELAKISQENNFGYED